MRIAVMLFLMAGAVLCTPSIAREADYAWGTAAEDEITAMLQTSFQQGSVPGPANITANWSCTIYSAIRSGYTVTPAPNRYQFVPQGHLFENKANPKFPVWQIANGTFSNNSIEAIPLPHPIDPGVTRYGRMTREGKLLIEATTSDPRVKTFTLPSTSNPTLNVFAYELCRR